MKVSNYKTHRAYLVARIHALRGEVDGGGRAAFREQSRRILCRLVGELDDLDVKMEGTHDA